MKNRVKISLILLCAGILVNVALALVKLYVGLSTNSLTIMLDAINSFFDIITCVVTAIAVAILLRPKSETSPHGYGRSEYLASFCVAAVTVVVGALFFIRSLNRMAMPEPVWFGAESCALIAAAIPLKLGLGLAYRYANKKIRSKAFDALALDSFLDTGITTASLVCFLISSRVDYAVDAIFGMALSVLIVIFAVKMVWDSVKSLVAGDARDEGESAKSAAQNALATSSVKGELISVDVHDYGYGEKVADVYIAFDDDASAGEIAKLRDDIAKGAQGVAINVVPILRQDDAISAEKSA